ncbi:MAG: hypothetical protein SGILL_000850 [Bacillariaceae sp.]
MWPLIQFLVAVYTCMLPAAVTAWEQCPEEAGGGICPNRATCCPSGIPGVSSCISGRARDPAGVGGECCDVMTGCSFGYVCDVQQSVLQGSKVAEPICRREKDHPDYLNAPQTKRYEMCRVSPDMTPQKLHAFPIIDEENDQSTSYNLGYYSSLGSVTEDLHSNHDARFDSLETVLIIIHGSGRTAEDYLCAGLSVIPRSASNLHNVVNDNYNKYMVIAPFFAANVDETERSQIDDLLYWADKGDDVPLSHTWRYGAEAINGKNISSYGALDNMIEHLISDTKKFPRLKQVVLAGHSAGGQVVHRWALLSSSPTIWDQQKVEIRVVVANPRSYCYLDNRRVLFQNSTNNTEHDPYAIPSEKDIESCPYYSQWQWGLQPGGDVVSHYKERILYDTNPTQLAIRYGSRNVFYLTGELDVIEQMDRCETKKFQGLNRNHRARNYWKALTEFFSDEGNRNELRRGDLQHEFHVVKGSPHDHMLMFQSDTGRRALFGEQSDDNDNDKVISVGAASVFQQLVNFINRCKQFTLYTASSRLEKGTIRMRRAEREYH